ncbi:MAG: hypothetical protein SF182_03940 [Deltaproteobacteria bacterium]|nr:hypothetical protein [Deltaproteobacteria bacterium]
MSRAASIALVLVAAASTARGDDLAAFLAAASAASAPKQTIRGEGELVTTSPDGTTRQQVVVVQRPNGDLFIALQPSGARALIPVGGEAQLSTAKGSGATPFALDAPLGGSEFTREDLQPFVMARFGSPTIVDRNGPEITVSLDPKKPTQYSLTAITFDRDKRAPVKVMLYKDTLSNLLKMRRDSDLVEVGGRWVPGTVAMENFPMRTTSTLTLKWSTAADQPELFDVKGW